MNKRVEVLPLTDSEQKILRWLDEGVDVEIIASRLEIHPGTVENYVLRAEGKLAKLHYKRYKTLLKS